MNREFFFYKSYVTDVKDFFTEKQYREYVEAIIYYGVTGSYHIEDASILPAFIQRKASIDASQARYKSSKINGRKGGRPRTITKGEIIEALKLGLGYENNIKEVADFFGCSERTILRRFNKQELEELIKMAEIRRHVQRNNNLSRCGSKYDYFFILCDAFGIKNNYMKYFAYQPFWRGHKWEHGYCPNNKKKGGTENV